MKVLTLFKTLEYYDVPQILVAADATGTNYLCTLYKNDVEDGYLYLGVQISEPRLMAFVTISRSLVCLSTLYSSTLF